MTMNYINHMSIIIVACLLITAVLNDSVKESFLQRYKSADWGEGVSSDLCYNMDYLIRLQRTVDYRDVHKIVEIGFGDWKMMQQIHFQGKQYLGYEVVDGLTKIGLPANVKLNYINKIQQITESGDLLIIKDVLMYLSNTDIHYTINTLLPKYKYALIEISATDQLHKDVPTTGYRPLKLDFKNGTKVIEKIYKSTRKETWLIRNNMK